MSLAEVGAYIRLLCHAWDAGGIPDNPARLARICGCSLEELEEVWPLVSEKWEPGPDGQLVNKPQEECRRQQETAHKKASEAGRRGARTRWGGHSRAISSANGDPNSGEGEGEGEGQGKNKGEDQTTNRGSSGDRLTGTREYIFGPEGLLCAGLAQSVVPEAITHLQSDRWLGSHPKQLVKQRLDHIREVSKGANNPGGFILTALRQDQADNSVPIKLKKEPTAADGAGRHRWAGSDDPELAAARLRKQALDCNKDADRLRGAAGILRTEGDQAGAQDRIDQALKKDEMAQQLVLQAEALHPEGSDE
jgi:uncharacterized protein YdaU (DUF1376 family)